MSIVALNWAWRQHVGCPTRKLILQRLADSADQTGFCWPSTHSIALYCEVTERTVQRNLRKLAHDQFISIAPRFAPSGRQRSNGYQLHLWNTEGDKLSPSANAATEKNIVDTPEGGVTQQHRADIHAVQSTNESSNIPPSKNLEEELKEFIWPAGLPMEARANFLREGSHLGQAKLQELLDELAWQLQAGVVRNPMGYLRTILAKALRNEFRPEFALLERARRERIAMHGVRPTARESENARPSEETKKQIKKLVTEMRAKLKAHRNEPPNPTKGENE